MSEQLKNQLRDYFEFVDEEQGAVEIADLQERGVAEQPVRPAEKPVPEATEPWPEFEDAVEPSASPWTRFKVPAVSASLGLAVAAPVAVGLFLILSSSNTEPDVRAPAGNAPTTTVPPALEPEPEAPVEIEVSAVDEALSVGDAYFAGRNAGDVDSVLALFTADAAFSNNFGPDVWDLAAFELDLAWNLAQGETLVVSQECTVADEVPGASVSIKCVYGTHDAPGLAVDSPLIPTPRG